MNYHNHEIKFEGNKQWLLITSDWHFDNPKTNRKLLFRHLDEAVDRNAKIIINGDMLCLMQGKYDPRKSKSAILQEHNGDNYLDLVIEDTAKKMVKYAPYILQINTGNHETAVSARNETDILQRLVDRINHLAGTNIAKGEYMGYINLQLKVSGCHPSIKIAYDHGHFGGIITKGALSVVRHASIFPSADIVISGHTHDGWIMNHPQFVLNTSKGKVEVRNQWHVKTGTYKEEFDSGKGWAVEKIGMPKYLGSCWVRLHYARIKENLREMRMEFTLTS